jgi:hypothetical protein
MTNEEIAAFLSAFASQHGRRWKTILADTWANGGDVEFGWQARWIRNHRGPSWLRNLKLK